MMKKVTIAGVFVGVAIAVLLYWQHVGNTRFDQNFRQQLAGAWLCQEAGMRCTNTFEADGRFVELSSFNHPDRTNTYQRTGTWAVEDGRLMEMVKTSSNPTEVTPHTLAGHIVRADAGGFTLRWPNSGETSWQRVGQ
jgi:hypothetical protein